MYLLHMLKLIRLISLKLLQIYQAAFDNGTVCCLWLVVSSITKLLQMQIFIFYK